ncbi:MAG: N-acetyltransferase [Bacteroidia bacterium]|nr:N-acetyltransferase [Bacteroidia bacterium]
MELINDGEKKHYEFHIGEHVPRVEYMAVGGKMFLNHTEIPRELEGQGIGSQLIKAVLEDVEKKGLILMPMCPFVAGYIQRHPEWKKLVHKGINIG